MKSKIRLIKNIILNVIIIMFFATTCSNASWIFEPDGIGSFATTTHGSETIFCAQLGGHLGTSRLLSGLYQGQTSGDFCSKCEGDKPAVSTLGESIAYTYEYESSENIDASRHQDVAYALATSGDQEKVQSAIWQTDINKTEAKTWDQILAKHPDQADDDGLYEEAKAYREFYESLVANGGFVTNDNTNYSNVKTAVNQSDDTYTVGKYKIDYSNGIYTKPDGTLVYFGYISSMKLRNQNGTELTIVDILDSSGNSIKNRAYGMPTNNEEFYVKFKYDGTGTTTDVYLDVEFTYLEKCEASMRYWYGTEYQWAWDKQNSGRSDHEHGGRNTSHSHRASCGSATAGYPTCNGSLNSGWTPYTYTAKEWVLKKSTDQTIQILLGVDKVAGADYWARKVWEKSTLRTDANKIDITMDLEGIVFLDLPGGKATVNAKDSNGIYDGIDKLMANIEVTLYEEGGTTLATLKQVSGQLRTNATLTDSNGHFAFKGLNAQKKYYVTYKFNGQKYENTAYKVAISDYNTGSWQVISKASILDSDRLAYNKKFEEIHSYPGNYTNINNITGFGLSSNKTYKIYEQTDNTGQAEYQDIEKLQNDINSKIKNFMNSNGRYPNSTAEKRNIYQAVANENSGISEVKNKIQYIVDMEVIAKTGYKSSMQYYPVYNKFVIDTADRIIGGTTYKAIYNGQKHINLGLIEREKFDLTLYKDLMKVTIYINNKRYVYNYNSRKDEGLEVTVNESDFNSVQYAKRGTDISDRVNSTNLYERELRDSDIAYIDYLRRTGQDYSKRLRIFATYRIRVRNFTDGAITANVTELRDHFDSDYEFNNNVNSSVVTYGVVSIPEVQKRADGNYELSKTAGEYMSWSGTTAGNPTSTISTTDGKMTGIGLKTGEYFDVYNMLEVKTAAIEKLLTTNNSTKENYAQIGSYKTYYTNKREYCNGDTITNAGYVAGLVDRDSKPGNFNANSNEVQNFVRWTYTQDYKGKGGKEKTKLSRAIFEDDADKAPGINLKLLKEYRILKGNVWEDKIVKKALEDNNIRQGDGKNNDSQAINKLRVQLIDMDRVSPDNYTSYNTVADYYDRNQSGFVTADTLTDSSGNYQFQGYVPGNYLVRFIYGEQVLLTADNNGKVYNGEDYKSTLYTESDHQYGTDSNPNYWYEATKTQRKSDAQDNLVRRNEINGINSTMKFYDASVLNYYENRNGGYLTDLQNKARLFADTEKLVLEVEYVQRTSDYSKDVTNRTYVVENVDLGLVERPRSELTLTKNIENIRIIANSGQTIFDTEQAVNNLGWIKPEKYLTKNYNNNYDRNGMIQATVDENLMHGATVKILYRITVENTGEKDYLSADGSSVDKAFYNTAMPSTTAKLATTKADCILDYIENNLKFSNELDAIDIPKKYNQYWELVVGEDNKGVKTDRLGTVLTAGTDSLVDPSLTSTVKKYNTIVRTTSNSPLLKELLPSQNGRVADNKRGEQTSDTLLLTKVLDTSDNSDDSYVYDNGLEIVQTTNKVGRRNYNNKDKSKYNEDDQITKAQIISSIPGNYVATNASDQNRAENVVTSEPDSDYAERVTVLVPFGEKNYIIILVSSIIAIIVLGIGIILIKKKVLRK